MPELKCGSSCREDLIGKIDDVELECIQKSGVWRFVTVLFVVITLLVGVTTTIITGDTARRDTAIKENQVKITEAQLSLARIQQNLQQLKEGQEAMVTSQSRLDDKLDNLSKSLLREIRLSR